MSAFELGCVGERYESDSVTVSLQDSGVSVYANGGWHSMGGHATLTPDQARQLGHLLIRAADNHDELLARKAQIFPAGDQSLASDMQITTRARA